MYDIFKKSKEIIESLNKENKNYWESNDIQWNHEAVAMDGSIYDEQELLESIKESDRQRLLRFNNS